MKPFDEKLAAQMGTTPHLISTRERAISHRQFPDLHAPTGEVLALAEQIPGGDAESIRSLMEMARKNLYEHRVVESDDAERLYLRRTADEILKSGKVAVHPERGIHGCQDYALVTMALLRAKGISDYEFVRLLPRLQAGNGQPVQANHSVILVTIDGANYRIDLSRRKPMVPITDRRIRFLKQSAMTGKDSFDVGITSADNAFFGKGGKFGRPDKGK